MPKSDFPDWEIYIRDYCICRYCGISGIQDFHSWRHLQIDHVVPKEHGGSQGAGNKVVCCARCNQLLRDRKPEGATFAEQVEWKRAIIRDKIRGEFRDFEEMMRELLPLLWSPNTQERG